MEPSANTCPHISGYAIVEQLYLGSRTAVYRALQTATQRPVVIKVLQRDYPSLGELVQFRNQYAITKNLSIAGIAQPLSLEPVGSRYALVMEDWGGVALAKYLQQQTLDLSEVLAIAIQIADILHDLIQHRVVHKDIKPANILIHPDTKQVKLIDFSIASLLPKETQEIQSPNILEGTLAYLAPEQTGRMNRGIDYRGDFYALGVTLYQLLTGQLPFTSDDPLELIHCHIARVPLSAEQVNPDVPEQVAAIVAKLMAKNAEDRYQSALGIKHDLTECLTQWQETGRITAFELGARDLSDRFLIPEKLYGRETEVQTLLDAFDRVAAGASELMLVAGFSGIGKTVVINEVHKPIARQRGYFIKGKFDQFNRNIPFSAFVQALQDLMGQLLSESDEQLAQWKAQILAVVGENGQALIEVIPELEQIIGKQPPIPELSGSAAQNRFNLLFQKFIEVFTTADHPLVIFLDDLQWSDAASLQLLKLLMNDSGYLLVLGAYRDNEVSPVHPFILTIEELKKAQAIVHTITLAPLAFGDTNHLIADTLNCSLELAQPLTELIDRKTQGNPFFTTQFLKALHEDGYIRFDRDRRYWECDITQVNALALTDDVVEFMALQLQKLPFETQQVLKLAACVGNQFDLATLAIISERSTTDAATVLWKALQDGLILPTSQVYKFFQDAEQDAEQTDVQSPVNPTYRFLHDRVQQAAYSIIAADQKQATHLKIGQLLQQNLSELEKEEKLFDIVGHLNLGRDLIVDDLHRIQLIKLNVSAGEKARKSTAYEAFKNYLVIAKQSLVNSEWDNQYELMFKVHRLLAEAEQLNNNFQESEKLILTTLEKAKTDLEQAELYALWIVQYTTLGQGGMAINTGRKALALLNVSLPQPETIEQCLNALFEDVKIRIEETSAEDWLSLPEVAIPQQRMAIQLLNSLLPAAYISQQEKLYFWLGVKIVELSHQYGTAPASSDGFISYGMFLGSELSNYRAGYDFGLLGLQLSRKYNKLDDVSRSCYTFANNIYPWYKPLKETEKIFDEGIRAGLESGNFLFVGYSLVYKLLNPFLQGNNLSEILSSLPQYLSFVQKNNHKVGEHAILAIEIIAKNLADQKNSLLEIEDGIEQKYLEDCNRHQSIYALCHYYILKSMTLYLYGKSSDALSASQAAEKMVAALVSKYQVAIHAFYNSLSILDLYLKAPLSQQQEYWQKISHNQQRMRIWAEQCPENFQHKYWLVKAEIARVTGKRLAATELYDRAIAGAKANGYIQEAALANELAAKFYLDWGKEKIAQEYLTNAYYGYAHWGARAKVQDLEHHYSSLLAPILQPHLIALSTTETMASLSASHLSKPSGTTILHSLDLATVLKASQTLSSEIHLDKLLSTLLHTVLENAGADKAVLVMPHNNQWFVEAVASVDQPVRVQSIALSDSPELPHSLIYTVKHSLQPVVIVDAKVHPTLVGDIYVVQQQPSSLLCTPILHQGKLVAILYLENRVTVGAFTSDRVELLNFLCAQAAISLENARLYQQAQTYAQQLEQSHLQVIQSEKMASLGNLVAGVAHEINNPLGFLNGSINNAQECVQDLLDYLALYQQHHPNPAAPVQGKAEDIDLEFLSEDLPKLLASMKGATDLIKGISTSLRTFARADTERKVSANLHEGLDSTLLILKYRLKANEHRPAIDVIQDYGELPLIECFPGQLNQVFMNVLANAIDMFDEMAQTQTFEELKTNPQKITIRTTVEANHVLIQVRDNGKGMTKEVQAKIFDHLFTTKAVGKGTGLGLTIARQIVTEKHGGSLDVWSELNQGTEFCIRLPIDVAHGCS